MSKTKQVENDDYMFDPCPIVDKMENKQKGMYRLQGMCFVLEHFPELKTHCPNCQYFKELPPNSYICKRFYCTLEKS